MKVQVKLNPLNIGNGFWAVGSVFEVVSETKCYFILNNGYRINKRHMSLAGDVCGKHSVVFSVV